MLRPYGAHSHPEGGLERDDQPRRPLDLIDRAAGVIAVVALLEVGVDVGPEAATFEAEADVLREEELDAAAEAGREVVLGVQLGEVRLDAGQADGADDVWVHLPLPALEEEAGVVEAEVQVAQLLGGGEQPLVDAERGPAPGGRAGAARRG